VRIAIRKRGAHRQRHKRLGIGARKPQQQRPHHPGEGDEHRDRIAGKPAERRAFSARPRDHPHRHRPPRLDADAPEHQPPDTLDCGAHMISLAGRDATRGQHQVMIPGRGCDRALELISIIRQDAEIG
jgi:hypothetical protein